LSQVRIRRAREADSKRIIQLVRELARFEGLKPPTKAGSQRLVGDVFRRKRINLFVAESGGELVGYAIYFFTYSSFLAKPSLYLEDIFVLDEFRKR
jgi:hypothetical protein